MGQGRRGGWCAGGVKSEGKAVKMTVALLGTIAGIGFSTLVIAASNDNEEKLKKCSKLLEERPATSGTPADKWSLYQECMGRPRKDIGQEDVKKFMERK